MLAIVRLKMDRGEFNRLVKKLWGDPEITNAIVSYVYQSTLDEGQIVFMEKNAVPLEYEGVQMRECLLPTTWKAWQKDVVEYR